MNEELGCQGKGIIKNKIDLMLIIVPDVRLAKLLQNDIDAKDKDSMQDDRVNRRTIASSDALEESTPVDIIFNKEIYSQLMMTCK